MPICIYCNKREADSKEHAIPAAFGMDNIKGFSTLDGKLCSECNSYIGNIEEQFLRCSPEAFLRYINDIQGRKTHKKINPFVRGSAGGKPIKVEVTSGKLRVFFVRLRNVQVN